MLGNGKWSAAGVGIAYISSPELTVIIDVPCRPRMWDQPESRRGNHQERLSDTTRNS